MLHLDSLSRTANAAYACALFGTRPHPEIISRLVDFHVPHSTDDSCGFDLDQLQAMMKPHWTLLWSKTYSYLGALSELRASKKWRAKARTLSKKFPADGADFCAVLCRSGK